MSRLVHVRYWLLGIVPTWTMIVRDRAEARQRLRPWCRYLFRLEVVSRRH